MSDQFPQLCCSWTAHKACQYAGFRETADLPCKAPSSKHAICNWRVRVANMPEASSEGRIPIDRRFG